MQVQKQDTLDELYIAYTNDRNSATPKPLKQWLSEYGDYRSELVMWATEHSALIAAEKDTLTLDQERIANETGRRVLAKFGLQPTEPVLKGLVEAAEVQGLNPRQFRKELGIGSTLLAKLQDRTLILATIPQKLVERIAEVLKIGVEQVRGYLSLPPTLAPSALYKSSSAPEVAAQQDFGDALASCSDMTSEEKAVWFS